MNHYVFWIANRCPVCPIPASDPRDYKTILEAYCAALRRQDERSAREGHEGMLASLKNQALLKKTEKSASNEFASDVDLALEDVAPPPASRSGLDEMLILETGSFIPGTIIAITTRPS